MMHTEKEQIALRFKGEDYKESAKLLQQEGFQPLGFNEWYSPTTGNRYRFMMSDGGKYITRVELLTDEGSQLINTEFCDRKLAIKRFDMENARPKPVTDDEVKQGVIHALFNFSPSHFTKMLQQASREADSKRPEKYRIYLVATNLFIYISHPFLAVYRNGRTIPTG